MIKQVGESVVTSERETASERSTCHGICTLSLNLQIESPGQRPGTVSGMAWQFNGSGISVVYTINGPEGRDFLTTSSLTDGISCQWSVASVIGTDSGGEIRGFAAGGGIPSKQEW